MIKLIQVRNSSRLAYCFDARYPITVPAEKVMWRMRWACFRYAWLKPFDFERAGALESATLKAELMRLAYCLAHLFPVEKESTGENVWLDARRKWGTHGAYSFFGCGFFDVEIGCVGGLSSTNAISLNEITRMNLPSWQRTSYDGPPDVVADHARRIMTETICRARQAVRDGRAINQFYAWVFLKITTRRIKENQRGTLV